MSEPSVAVKYESAKKEFEKARSDYLAACDQYRAAADRLEARRTDLLKDLDEIKRIPFLPEFVVNEPDYEQ